MPLVRSLMLTRNDQSLYLITKEQQSHQIQYSLNTSFQLSNQLKDCCLLQILEHKQGQDECTQFLSSLESSSPFFSFFFFSLSLSINCKSLFYRFCPFKGIYSSVFVIPLSPFSLYLLSFRFQTAEFQLFDCRLCFSSLSLSQDYLASAAICVYSWLRSQSQLARLSLQEKIYKVSAISCNMISADYLFSLCFQDATQQSIFRKHFTIQNSQKQKYKFLTHFHRLCLNDDQYLQLQVTMNGVKLVNKYEFMTEKIQVQDGIKIISARRTVENKLYSLRKLKLNDKNKEKYLSLMNKITILKQIRDDRVIVCHEFLKTATSFYVSYDHISQNCLRYFVQQHRDTLQLAQKSKIAAKVSEFFMFLKINNLVNLKINHPKFNSYKTSEIQKKFQVLITFNIICLFISLFLNLQLKAQQTVISHLQS